MNEYQIIQLLAEQIEKLKEKNGRLELNQMYWKSIAESRKQEMRDIEEELDYWNTW